jgi:hypothetical protein
MNVNTIIISPEEAREKLDQYYKSIVNKKRVAEDDKLQSLYASVARGARILNLESAFRQTGLNELKQPKLAIARADWATVHCFRWSMSGLNYGLRFSECNDGWKKRVSDLRLSLDLPAKDLFEGTRLSSRVPHIPPDCRPKFKLHNYHILFEVERWDVYPVDPFLLRRISGMLFVVEAEWELTQLEASLLASMTQGT